MAEENRDAEAEQAPRSLDEWTRTDLWAEGMRLNPWHLEVQIAPGLSTRDFHEADRVPAGHTFYDPAPRLKSLLQRIYPAGLEGRSVLDCACNNGAFLFAARDIGAGRCFGVDVRDHWIDQARFVARHRAGAEDFRFQTLDLYEIPTLDLDPFDITFFTGIFYHLPDPIQGLKIAADLTNELIFVSTQARAGLPDGMLVAEEEPTDALYGVYGLNWLPTGPRVITRLLEYMGFEETRCYQWRPSGAGREMDFVQVVAGREKGSLAGFDAGDRGLMKDVRRNVRPRATVLVATQGTDRVRSLPFREVWQFPRDPAGRYDPSLDGRSDALAAHLQDLRIAGASYLLIPKFAFAWLGQNPDFHRHLQTHYKLVGDEPRTCLLYDLGD
jgi:SAM-dependent methyltransferase